MKRLDHSQTLAPESDPYGLRSLCKTLMLHNNFAMMMMMRRRSHLPLATQCSRSSKLVRCKSDLANPSDEKTPVWDRCPRFRMSQLGNLCFVVALFDANRGVMTQVQIDPLESKCIRHSRVWWRRELECGGADPPSMEDRFEHPCTTNSQPMIREIRQLLTDELFEFEK